MPGNQTLQAKSALSNSNMFILSKGYVYYLKQTGVHASPCFLKQSPEAVLVSINWLNKL